MKKITFYTGTLEFVILVLVAIFLVSAVCKSCSMVKPAIAETIQAEYTNKQIADAIYKAEGSEKAVKPYGILSVECEGEKECRKICLNTIRNNRKRYADYGYKKYDTYLEFLASRYAPVDAENDPQGLNRNWVRLVKYFLTNPK